MGTLKTPRKRKLTRRQKLLRRRYTKRHGTGVFLVIDHQSFKLESFIEDDEDMVKHAEWRRDQLAIALDRLAVTAPSLCPDHPTYKAMKPPRPGAGGVRCAQCDLLYTAYEAWRNPTLPVIEDTAERVFKR